MRIIALTAAALAATLFAGAAQAGPYSPRVDARQANQDARIDHGVATGRLTPAETRRLEAGQNRIDRMENRFRADGHLSWGERARLEAAQNRESRRIWRKKHNLRNW